MVQPRRMNLVARVASGGVPTCEMEPIVDE